MYKHYLAILGKVEKAVRGKTTTRKIVGAIRDIDRAERKRIIEGLKKPITIFDQIPKSNIDRIVASHKVTFIPTSGNLRWFEVISGTSGEKYSVSLDIKCDCWHHANRAGVNQKHRLCSHSLSALKKVIKAEELE